MLHFFSIRNWCFSMNKLIKKSRICPLDPSRGLGGGGKVLPITAYTGRLRPKGQETHEGRDICHCGMWKDLKGLTGSFYGCEKDKKTFWFSDLFIFKRRLRKGYLRCQKWFVRGWGSGLGRGVEPFPYKMLYPPPPGVIIVYSVWRLKTR